MLQFGQQSNDSLPLLPAKWAFFCCRQILKKILDIELMKLPVNPAGQIVNPACQIGNPASQIGNPAGQIGNPAGQIGNPAGQIGNPAGQIGNPAGKIGITSSQIGNPAIQKSCQQDRLFGRQDFQQ